MRRSKTPFLVAAMIGLSILFSGCGTSSWPAATPPNASPGPADRGLGTWSYADNREVVTVLFDPKGTNDLAKAAEACRVAMNAEPVVWIIVSAENKTGDQMRLSTVTIVSGDGHQYSAGSAVDALNGWYVNAPDSTARAACVTTSSDLSKSQIGNDIAPVDTPGATFVALAYVPATVTSVKWVTAHGYGDQLITLAYGS